MECTKITKSMPKKHPFTIVSWFGEAPLVQQRASSFDIEWGTLYTTPSLKHRRRYCCSCFTFWGRRHPSFIFRLLLGFSEESYFSSILVSLFVISVGTNPQFDRKFPIKSGVWKISVSQLFAVSLMVKNLNFMAQMT